MKKWLRKHKSLVANLALVAVMILGLSYLTFGSLGWRPLRDTYDVTIHFPVSGGVQNSSVVTMRGARVGSVRNIQVEPKSVKVVVRIDANHKINQNATVSALGLSAAGEQYVDFTPSTDEGPFLRNGDVIEVGQTFVDGDGETIDQVRVTVPFPDLLESAMNFVDEVDADQLTLALNELTYAFNNQDGAPNNLKSIFESIGTIFSELYVQLPATNALIANVGDILHTSANIQPDLNRMIYGASDIADQAAAADAELRELLGKGPARMTSLTGSISDIGDPITGALGEFIEVLEQGSLRAPTLVNLLPSIRDGSITLQKMFHDGAWWALASIYPRPYCDYQLATPPPTQILALTLPTNLYCVNANDGQQIRGSVNAPRPEGDDTAGPPPNYDPNARTVPLN